MTALLRILSLTFLLAGFASGAALAEPVKVSTKAPAAAGLLSKETAKKSSKTSVEPAKDEIKIKTVAKTVTGRVVSIWSNKLSVQYAESEETGAEEMLIPLDKKMKISGAKDLSEVKPGDTVKVVYEIRFEDKKWEGEPVILGTKARSLERVSQAPVAGALYAE